MSHDALGASGRVWIAGSANLDFVVRADHVPAPGETVLGRDFATFPGGKGANQAVACARAGAAETRMLLALGEDDFAVPLERSLREAGVGLDVVRCPDCATGTAFICLADNAENAITVAPGANARLAPTDLPPLTGADWLLLQLETPVETVAAYAQAAREQGVRVALNAAPAQALEEGLLATLDLLIVNEGELAAIAGAQGSIADALRRLPVPAVAVTLGACGSCARVGEDFLLQPGFAVEAVDTTGAGDTFCGVLVAALAGGGDWPQALRRAAAAAALACTRLGAQSSIPVAGEVDGFLRSSPHAAAPDALAAHCGL
ncbi:ribokinase [Pseudoxanthomonas kalamensis DSM 18571]|uniref:ribokinase n=1 Tax=Pseudoxanthomonas kalamensis TaxID=289483 RepID=UPI00139169B7|nr:ribokinase [Pseudoxanthomonas kalamensis]KAF1711445.1 ribokinase [Pseudoxanthomonas kalamensis DSM 18571]